MFFSTPWDKLSYTSSLPHPGYTQPPIHNYALILLTGYPYLRAYFHDIFDFHSQDMEVRIR